MEDYVLLKKGIENNVYRLRSKETRMATEGNMKTISRLLFIILLFFCVFFLMRNRVHSSEYKYPSSKEVIHSYKTFYKERPGKIAGYKVSGTTKKTWRREFNFHEKEGIKCYEKAKSMCWYLPQQSDKEMAEGCFITAMSMIAGSSPTSKVVAATITGLTQAGIAMMDEWNSIQHHLYWANYHFELCDFYSNLINNSDEV